MAQQVVISFNANANFSDLIGEIKRANAEIGVLQNQLQGLGSSSFGSLDVLNKQFVEGMKNSRMWSSTFVDVTNETREFGKHLDQGRLKLKDYFREFNTQVKGQRGMIRKLAEEQVRLQRSVLTTTVGPQGQTKNILSTPTGLDGLDPATMKALRSETFKIIGKSIQGVSTELINLGKNTQWAGRQLTVGLTVPLTMFAASAATAFKEVDKQLTRLAKVYGDLGGATTGEIAAIRTQTTALAKSLAADLGAPMQDTIGLAADIAATGKTGDDLLKSVAETTRLAVLGEVDRQDAMSATLSLQNAFNLSTQELGESINFLNAVENQTSTSLDDLVTAIPKAGPVVKSLGGDVKDLALFLTAMKEGGINASEGANALKSGLASIINPTKQTTEVLNGFGINIQGIVNQNAGDLVGTVQALQIALSKLDPLSKSKAIEQLFGKFQFARMSALFDNLGASGSQTLQVMDLMKASTIELANVADRELSILTESASGKFARQMESFKANMAGVGEGFLGIFSGVLGVLNKLLEGFNKLPDGVKNIMTILGVVVGLAGPLIMLSGVFLNFFGYLTKAAGFMGRIFTGTKGFELLNEKIMANKLSAEGMSNSFYDQAKATEVARMEIDKLIASMQRLMEVQKTEASGAAQRLDAKDARGYVPVMAFDQKTGRDPGLSEFSHFMPKQERKKFAERTGASQELIDSLKTPGTYIPSIGLAAGFQQKMVEKMPSGLVPDNTSFEDMKNILMSAAKNERGKTALTQLLENSKNPEQELSSLFTKESDYAKIQAQHIANLKVFSKAYDQDAKAAANMALEVQRAQESGGVEAAALKIREFSAQLGIEYEKEVSEINAKILAALRTGGAEAGMDVAMTEELNAIGTTMRELKNTPREALIRLSSQIAQGSVYLNSITGDITTTVDTGVKRLGTVTVKLVGDTVQVISKAGNVLTSKAALNNPKVLAAIENLKKASNNLDQAVANDINQAAMQENSAAAIVAIDETGAVANSKVSLRDRFSATRGKFKEQGFRGLMKPGMGSSMAMMGLGMGASMMPTGGNGAMNTAGNIAGGAMMGASMGMMFGPIGTAVGAALGAIVPAATALWKAFDRLRDIAALTAKQYEIDKEYAKAAGLSLKTIGDIQLQQLTGKSAEAASALEILSKAALEASTNTSTGALREKTKGASSFKDVQGEFENQYLAYIAAGASEETAKVMMAAILKAAGKEGFTTDLNMALSKYSGQTAAQATASQFSNLTGGGIKGTGFGTAQDAAKAAGVDIKTAQSAYLGQYSSGENAKQAFMNYDSSRTEEQGNALARLVEEYNKLTPAQQKFASGNLDVAAAVNILDTAIANQPLAEFLTAMKEVDDAGMLTQDTVNGLAAKISGLGDLERGTLKGFANNGLDAATQMSILKLRTQGVITDISTLKNYDNTKIKIYIDYMVSEQKAKELKAEADKIIESLNLPTAGGGGSNEGAKKALQAKLKALQEEERIEKNIAKIKELQLKHEEKRRNLALDYLSAVSSGDLEGALRTQLDMQADSIAFAKEKAQTEKDIARDDEKARIQAQIDALDGAANAASGVSNATKKAKDDINAAMTSIITAFGANGNVQVALNAFTNSSELTAFKKKLTDLGFTPDQISKLVDSLKASIESAVKSAINSGTATGTGAGAGTKADPYRLMGITPAGFRYSKDNKAINKKALDEEQKRKIISDYELTSGQVFEVEGEKYVVGSNGDAVRQKNAQGLWMGGKVKGYAGGGYMGGVGTSTSDSNWIKASRGEFMQSARAVNYYGVANMEKLNRRQVDPRVFENMREAGDRSEGGVNVSIGSINITEPGCTSDEIIAKIKKDLGAAVKRTTDMRYMKV
jgi:TP901 family phage tail tape measure protein